MCTQCKVNILLSTYNGEQYLAQQLDSLLNQTYPNIHIYIRDDGSSDRTLNIIHEYISNHTNITFINTPDDHNLGYMKSFWTLLDYDDSADYYSFCDQDDVWLPNKVELGVKVLETLSEHSTPLLYSSSFQYCDENLNVTGNPINLPERIHLKDVLFYTPAFGFTILINKALRNAALCSPSHRDYPHDSWCQKIAASMGIFYHDSTITALYRRHSSTVTYAASSNMKLIRKWIKNDIFGNILDNNHDTIYHYLQDYKKKLSPEQKKLLSCFASQPFNLKTYATRLFFPHRLRPSLGGELALRICFLLGK